MNWFVGITSFLTLLVVVGIASNSDSSNHHDLPPYIAARMNKTLNNAFWTLLGLVLVIVWMVGWR